MRSAAVASFDPSVAINVFITDSLKVLSQLFCQIHRFRLQKEEGSVGYDVATNTTRILTMKRATHDDAVALHASAQNRTDERFLDGASASDQVVYQYDHSHDQQEMNQAGAATYTRYKTQ